MDDKERIEAMKQGAEKRKVQNKPVPALTHSGGRVNRMEFWRHVRGSSNGRTASFGVANRGSNPRPRASHLISMSGPATSHHPSMRLKASSPDQYTI